MVIPTAVLGTFLTSLPVNEKETLPPVSTGASWYVMHVISVSSSRFCHGCCTQAIFCMVRQCDLFIKNCHNPKNIETIENC